MIFRIDPVDGSIISNDGYGFNVVEPRDMMLFVPDVMLFVLDTMLVCLLLRCC